MKVNIKRLIIGISGASGAPIAIELLRQLKTLHKEIETHLVISQGAKLTLKQECNIEPENLINFVDVYHDNSEIGASIASGSFSTTGMIIVPCSMKTVAGIASGFSDNLLLRAADVCLKERRKLVLVARESPMNTIHLKNLWELSSYGAVILPPMLTYYNHPKTIEDCTNQTVKRILSQFDLDDGNNSWAGLV